MNHKLVGRGVLTAPRTGGLRTARPTLRDSWESPSESQYLFAVFDAALEFGSLELLFGEDHVPAFAHFERAASGASLDELKKPGELAWSQLEISIPEFIPQKRDGNRAARDGLENDGCVRAEFGVTFEVTLPVNTALPHRGPLQGCAVLDRPESGIANARGQCVRTQHFEILQRVFQRPGRVARIHRGPDKVAPGLLDERDQFPRLHVPGVVLDGDFHS